MNANVRCLKKACDSLGLTYREVGESKVFLEVDIHGKPYHFIANSVPFNDYTTTQIATDKSFATELLSPVMRMPRTKSYIDPDCEELYQPYVTYRSQDEIAEAIENDFAFPMVVKKNSGKRGEMVFVCHDQGELKEAVKSIFTKASNLYDYILLAQEYIKIDREYRVTIFNGEIVLVYEKDFSQAKFVGNLSPLHWEGAQAKIVSDAVFQEKLRGFIAPLFAKLALVYGGLDIAVDKQGNLCLFEINIQPGYTYLLAEAGDEPLVEIYQKMLKKLLTNE